MPDFLHVMPDIPTEELQKQRQVFLVNFDGNWEIWFSQRDHPDTAELQACISELSQYYRSDWKGTNRLLPMLSMKMTEYHTIDCL